MEKIVETGTEPMPTVEHATKEELASTLLVLKEKDTALRERLGEELEGDPTYSQLMADIAKWAKEAGNSLNEELDRAYADGTILKLIEKLNKTERHRVTQDFVRVSAMRESTELQVKQLEKALK